MFNSRQTSNEAKKIEKARLERDELSNKLADMSFRLEAQEAQIREMTRILADIGKLSQIVFETIVLPPFSLSLNFFL